MFVPEDTYPISGFTLYTVSAVMLLLVDTTFNNKMNFYVYFPAQMLLPSVLPHLGDLLEDGPAIIAFEVELHAVSFTPVHMLRFELLVQIVITKCDQGKLDNSSTLNYTCVA